MIHKMLLRMIEGTEENGGQFSDRVMKRRPSCVLFLIVFSGEVLR